MALLGGAAEQIGRAPGRPGPDRCLHPWRGRDIERHRIAAGRCLFQPGAGLDQVTRHAPPAQEEDAEIEPRREHARPMQPSRIARRRGHRYASFQASPGRRSEPADGRPADPASAARWMRRKPSRSAPRSSSTAPEPGLGIGVARGEGAQSRLADARSPLRWCRDGAAQGGETFCIVLCPRGVWGGEQCCQQRRPNLHGRWS